MISEISLTNFKCFGKEQKLSLAPITLLYGKNGRGKSTVAQSLMLLSQTMQQTNDISELNLIGRLISLGNYEELINNKQPDSPFQITLQTEKEHVNMVYCEAVGRKQMAKLNSLYVNGENRLEEKATNQEIQAAQELPIVRSAITSDISVLQNLKSLRYVSAERLGPRNETMRNDSLLPDDLGVDGRNVINILSANGVDFQREVCNRLSQILTGAALSVKDTGDDRISLFLNSADGEDLFRPKNVGFGYSYVLPVIVSALLAKKGSVLIIENPEAHLHPGAQSRLMKFLIEASKERNVQLIVETHSDHVVNGLRIAIKNGVIQPKDGHILYFSNEEGEECVKKITSDVNGTLSEYPDDFLDEWTSQMLKLV